MYVIRWVLLKSCIFGMYILVTDASVSLQTFDEGNAYLKDSEVTLVCTITPYNNEMTWYVDNDPYAGCFLGTCAPSVNKPYTFKFTFDETAGLFNLTIDSVNSSHAELLFACDDGSVRETISFNVTTDNGTTSNTSKTPTKPDINNQITVTNEGNGDNDDRTLGEGAIAGIGVAITFVIAVIITVVYRYTRKKKGTIEQNDAAQNYGGNGTETVQERPNALTNSVGESSIGSKDVIEVWNGTETVQVQPNALANSVGESSIGSKDVIEVNQSEMENEILAWMTDINKLFIIMNETIWKMEDQRKDELCQKIEKDKQRSGHKETIWKMEDQQTTIWKMEVQRKQRTGHKVTHPATREHILTKQLECIKRIIRMRNHDISNLYEELNREGLIGNRAFSSFLMKALQKDKAVYDNIIRVINKANADHRKSTMMIEDLLK